jgi:hypothetical protein
MMAGRMAFASFRGLAVGSMMIPASVSRLCVIFDFLAA